MRKNEKSILTKRNFLFNFLILLIGIYVFIGALEGLKSAWEIAFAPAGKKELAQNYINNVIGNPFSGLFVGILATALVQSSSGVVAVVIASCAAGAFSIAFAVPIILGANIGTTVTNTMVTLGYLLRRKFIKIEFIRATEASIIHDIFNIFNVSFFFILELTTKILSKSASFLADKIGNLPILGHIIKDFPDLTGVIVEKPIVDPFVTIIIKIIGYKGFLPAIIIGLISFAFLLFALRLMSNSMQRVMEKRVTKIISKAFQTKTRAVFIGGSLTWLLQSSSVATSLAVPFAASGIIKIKEIYPYTLGCNIGTTIDPGQIISYAKFGLTGFKVGFIHVLLNLIGVILWLGTPLRTIPPKLASKLAKWITSTHPLLLIVYIGVIFYVLPILIITIF
jgi:sodium-dependent phosphate cotransporter